MLDFEDASAMHLDLNFVLGLYRVEPCGREVDNITPCGLSDGCQNLVHHSRIVVESFFVSGLFLLSIFIYGIRTSVEEFSGFSYKLH